MCVKLISIGKSVLGAKYNKSIKQSPGHMRVKSPKQRNYIMAGEKVIMAIKLNHVFILVVELDHHWNQFIIIAHFTRCHFCRVFICIFTWCQDEAIIKRTYTPMVYEIIV